MEESRLDSWPAAHGAEHEPQLADVSRPGPADVRWRSRPLQRRDESGDPSRPTHNLQGHGRSWKTKKKRPTR